MVRILFRRTSLSWRSRVGDGEEKSPDISNPKVAPRRSVRFRPGQPDARRKYTVPQDFFPRPFVLHGASCLSRKDRYSMCPMPMSSASFMNICLEMWTTWSAMSLGNSFFTRAVILAISALESITGFLRLSLFMIFLQYFPGS